MRYLGTLEHSRVNSGGIWSKLSASTRICHQAPTFPLHEPKGTHRKSKVGQPEEITSQQHGPLKILLCGFGLVGIFLGEGCCMWFVFRMKLALLPLTYVKCTQSDLAVNLILPFRGGSGIWLFLKPFPLPIILKTKTIPYFNTFTHKPNNNCFLKIIQEETESLVNCIEEGTAQCTTDIWISSSTCKAYLSLTDL